jgi:hypothetical protein
VSSPVAGIACPLSLPRWKLPEQSLKRRELSQPCTVSQAGRKRAAAAAAAAAAKRMQLRWDRLDRRNNKNYNVGVQNSLRHSVHGEKEERRGREGILQASNKWHFGIYIQQKSRCSAGHWREPSRCGRPRAHLLCFPSCAARAGLGPAAAACRSRWVLTSPSRQDEVHTLRSPAPPVHCTNRRICCPWPNRMREDCCQLAMSQSSSYSSAALFPQNLTVHSTSPSGPGRTPDHPSRAGVALCQI